MTHNELKITTNSPEETRELGTRIGELAQPGDVILLVGELGAGKTCLTQGIAWGLGITDYALSPSFVIMRELYGRLPLYHLDLYRLENPEEIIDLGLDDYLYGSGVCVVEWADRGLEILPLENLLIKITSTGDRRDFQLIPSGEHYREMIGKLTKNPVRGKS